MSRFTIAKAKYPYLKPYLFCKCFKENLRNKTAFRQRYFFIRKFIIQYMVAAKIKTNINGFNKIDNLKGAFIVSNAKNELEKLLTFAAISKPIKVILDNSDFNKIIYKPILKYLKIDFIDYDNLEQTIKNIDENDDANYLLFVDENNDKQLDLLIDMKKLIMPIKLENTENLLNDENQDELLINANVLDLIKYDEYSKIEREDLKSKIFNN